MISILGLAIVQYQYLRVGLNLAKVQFNSKLGKVSEEISQGLESKNQLTFLMGKSLGEDDSFFKISRDSLKVVSNNYLNDYISEKLVNNGIEADFTYKLQTKDSTYYLTSPALVDTSVKIDSYPIELKGYLPELFEKKVILELQFKDLNSFFLSKLDGLIFPGILFIIGICITVIWVLRTFYWQRNIITTTNEFINNLTHELKTPVFSIGLATRILKESALPDQQPVLDMIKQQVKRLTVHIDKVLQLGNLESGNNIMQLEKVEFRPYLVKLCKEFETLISIENVKFNYEIEEKPFLIKAEVFHLENAINNILDNAKKFAENPIIRLNAYELKGKLVIEIRDNGMGVSKEDKNKIFLKYYRGSTTEHKLTKGYGLGLSYVKNVIEKHKGKITIDSILGKGSKICITIPICYE